MKPIRVKVKRRASAALAAVAPLLALFAAWEWVSRGSEAVGLFMPPPSLVLPYFVSGFREGTLAWMTLLTLKRAAYSYAVASAAAIPLGLLIGWRRRLYRAFEPIVEALRPIPSTALIAPAILFLGLGEATIQFVAFYAVFWVVLINALYGVYAVDRLSLLAFRTMRARDSQVFIKLVLPSSLPFVFAGLRQAVAVALIVTVAAEMLVGSDGLGFFLLESERTFNYEPIYASLLVLSAVGYGLNKGMLALQHRVLRWARETHVAP